MQNHTDLILYSTLKQLQHETIKNNILPSTVCLANVVFFEDANFQRLE